MSEAYSPQLQSAVMSAFPTILQAHEATKIPAIVHVAQAYDEDVAMKWVQQQLLAVNEFAGAKAKLTDFQLDELAIQIRLEYGYLNLFEFILFCARLRSGKYEDFYGSIDPMRILKSLDAFCDDRRREINRAYEEKERIAREREYEESKKNSISFEDWYLSKSEEERAKTREVPYFAKMAKEIEERERLKSGENNPNDNNG